MNPTNNRLYWMYQKKKHLIDALILHHAPKFVYQLKASLIEGEIPVFTFHLALPDWFDEQCKYLVENDYNTLTAEEFDHLIRNSDAQFKNCVFLTFDDGLKHVWTIAYPLLKKYGLHATCYLIPGCIPENDTQIRPNLDDVWQGNASISDVMGIRKNESALCSWEEIKIMHESGVIDFQSHTMTHGLVPVSDEIIDFINPHFDPYFYGNIHVPLYREKEKEVTSREPLLGMPLYRSKPRMQAETRYFDDEHLRNYCISEVKKCGGKLFFNNKNWKSVLVELVRNYKINNIISDQYEDIHDRDQALLEEFCESKRIIEEKLPGKEVTQLCFPWYEAGDFAIEMSKKAGYKINLFGRRKGHLTNRPGSNPFEIVRVEDIFLERLPGNGRKSILQTLVKLYNLRTLPSQLFPEGRNKIL